MPRVLVPLAPGCEELEAVTIVDLLRRAEIEVGTAGLGEGPVRASRGTVLVPDTVLDKALEEEFDMVVLPGGMPGMENLRNDERILSLRVGCSPPAGSGAGTAAGGESGPIEN